MERAAGSVPSLCNTGEQLRCFARLSVFASETDSPAICFESGVCFRPGAELGGSELHGPGVDCGWQQCLEALGRTGHNAVVWAWHPGFRVWAHSTARLIREAGLGGEGGC